MCATVRDPPQRPLPLAQPHGPRIPGLRLDRCALCSRQTWLPGDNRSIPDYAARPAAPIRPARRESARRAGNARSALLLRATIPANNGRLARQGFVGDGFRRGDPEAGPDKGRQEAAEVHVREPRHAMIAARGLGETTDTGHRVRIIVKGFIKVPDAQ